MKTIAIVWAAVVVFLTPVVSAQVILRVDGDEGTVAGDGSAWGSSAFRYLQDALAEAADNASPSNPYEIWVAEAETAGPYRPDQSADGSMLGDPAATFELINNVRIYGGFTGDEPDLILRNPLNNVTVLSGDIGDDDISVLQYDPGQHQAFVDSRDENSYHVVSALDGVDDTALIDGFWIVHGGTSDIMADESDRRGGAMLITSARPRVIKVFVDLK